MDNAFLFAANLNTKVIQVYSHTQHSLMGDWPRQQPISIYDSVSLYHSLVFHIYSCRSFKQGDNENILAIIPPLGLQYSDRNTRMSVIQLL